MENKNKFIDGLFSLLTTVGLTSCVTYDDIQSHTWFLLSAVLSYVRNVVTFGRRPDLPSLQYGFAKDDVVEKSGRQQFGKKVLG